MKVFYFQTAFFYGRCHAKILKIRLHNKLPILFHIYSKNYVTIFVNWKFKKILNFGKRN